MDAQPGLNLSHPGTPCNAFKIDKLDKDRNEPDHVRTYFLKDVKTNQRHYLESSFSPLHTISSHFIWLCHLTHLTTIRETPAPERKCKMDANWLILQAVQVPRDRCSGTRRGEEGSLGQGIGRAQSSQPDLTPATHQAPSWTQIQTLVPGRHSALR